MKRQYAYRLSSFIFILSFVSGCIAIPLPQDDHESREKKDIVRSLVGETEESVIEKLGSPDQTIIVADQKFFVYSDRSGRKELGLVFLIPVGIFDVPEGEGYDTLHCFIIEMDSKNIVKSYDIESTTHTRHLKPCHSLISDDRKQKNLNNTLND